MISSLFAVFAWEAYEKGTDINVQADPTRLELLEKEYKKRKEDYKTGQKEGILTKYGGEEHLDAPPKQLLLAQTVCYCVLFILLIILSNAPSGCRFLP